MRFVRRNGWNLSKECQRLIRKRRNEELQTEKQRNIEGTEESGETGSGGRRNGKRDKPGKMGYPIPSFT
jgi:hypothetical protein